MRISDLDHRQPGNICPLCGHVVDAASGIDTDEAPDPGDLSVCINCASPLVFGPDLKLRTMTAAEYAELHPVERAQIEAAMATVRSFDRR